MKEVLKAYKYRIDPNAEQMVLLNKHFGSVRYVYNYFLNERKDQYRETKKSDNYVAQANKLTKLKKDEQKAYAFFRWEPSNTLMEMVLVVAIRCCL